MLIGGFQKSSLLDFPKNIAAIVFLQGCNFSCPYCHNPELVRPMTGEPLDKNSIFEFLKTRKGKLDGVVITGGEATLHSDLPEFISDIKNMGFKIKLDTNGTNPSMVQKLLYDNLLDYIAMDLKAGFSNYKKVSIRFDDVEKIKLTAKGIIKSDIDYEFRTTVVQNLLCYDDFVEINNFFKSFSPLKIKKYYLQKFQSSKHIDDTYINAKTFTNDEFEKVKALFQGTVETIMVR